MGVLPSHWRSKVNAPSGTDRLSPWIDRLGATARIAITISVALIAYFAQPESILWHTRLLASWDACTLVYLALAWTIIGCADAKSTRGHALAQDTSGYIIFLFVLGAPRAQAWSPSDSSWRRSSISRSGPRHGI
jgi:hypothetical protein